MKDRESSRPPEKTTVVVADDHAVVRSGLRLLLEADADVAVVAEAGDMEEALRKVRAYRPSILLLDLVMPGTSPIESIGEVAKVNQATRTVILTMQSDPGYAREALRAGAAGYVLKEAADDDLVGAIKEVAAGGTYVHPSLGAELAQEPERDKVARDLSEREVEVLKLIALGHTNQEIAQKLFLSVRTVESHRSHVQQKLRLNTRAELVRYALEHKLVEIE